MTTCDNCGSWVNPTYIRVMVPESEEGVQCCPECPDRTRRGNEIREYRYVTEESGD